MGTPFVQPTLKQAKRLSVTLHSNIPWLAPRAPVATSAQYRHPRRSETSAFNVPAQGRTWPESDTELAPEVCDLPDEQVEHLNTPDPTPLVVTSTDGTLLDCPPSLSPRR